MKSLLFITIFLPIFLHAEESFMKRDNSLLPPYNNGNWDFYGSTLMSVKHVSVTGNYQSQAGAIWNKHPLNVPNWEIHVNFRVHGNDGLLFGDGMALWYLNETVKPGQVFGASPQFRGLAIFMDTYSNHNGPHHHEHPYISAMVNDGSRIYDHDTDGTHTQLAGCTAHFRNKQHDTYLLIRYAGNTLTVMTDISKENKWHPCLEVNDVYLPTGYFLAVSAATGDLSDNHEVISLKTYSVYSEKVSDNEDRSKLTPSASKFEPEREHKEDEPKPSRWRDFAFLFYILIFLIICGAAYFIFMYYERQRHNSKRFY